MNGNSPKKVSFPFEILSRLASPQDLPFSSVSLLFVDRYDDVTELLIYLEKQHTNFRKYFIVNSNRIWLAKKLTFERKHLELSKYLTNEASVRREFNIKQRDLSTHLPSNPSGVLQDLSKI